MATCRAAQRTCPLVYPPVRLAGWPGHALRTHQAPTYTRLHRSLSLQRCLPTASGARGRSGSRPPPAAAPRAQRKAGGAGGRAPPHAGCINIFSQPHTGKNGERERVGAQAAAAAGSGAAGREAYLVRPLAAVFLQPRRHSCDTALVRVEALMCPSRSGGAPRRPPAARLQPMAAQGIARCCSRLRPQYC